MTLRAAAVAIAMMLSGQTVADPAARVDDAPPARLISGEPTRGAAIDPVLAHLRLERLSCAFSEEKRVALLARPLASTGTIHFARDRGIARTTLTPKPQRAVLTTKSLRIYKDKRTEEIPLDKSRDLKAFALIFPALLRGDRVELERSFELGLHGSDRDWWALVLAPRSDSLRGVVRRIVVIGRKSELVSLHIAEANGDTTDTRMSHISKNAGVPDAEIAKAFAPP